MTGGGSGQEADGSTSAGRVLVVDDERAIRDAAVRALERAGLEVVAAPSVVAAMSLMDEPFDVAVLDVELPDGTGFQLVEALRNKSAALVPIVMITGSPDSAKVSESIRYGIVEFLFKPFDLSELLDTVQRALEARARWKDRVKDVDLDVVPSGGGEALPPNEVSRLIESLSTKHGLTDREVEVLGLILAGLQNADIATQLNISANTVKYHARNVFTKLGVESRVQLFRQLIQPSD